MKKRRAGTYKLGVALARLLSAFRHKPPGALAQKAAEGEPPKGVEQAFLSARLDEMTEQLRRCEQAECRYRHMAKNNWLYGLLSGGEAAEREGFLRAAGEYRLGLSPDEGFFVLVLAIDGRRALETAYTVRERAAARLAALNAVTEVLSAACVCEGVELPGAGTAAILVNADGARAEERLLQLVAVAQRHVMRHLALSVSFSVSAFSAQLAGVPGLYEQAAQNMAYRFQAGKMCVVTAQSVQIRARGGQAAPGFPLEKKLAEAVRAGDIPAVEALLQRVGEQIRGQSTFDMMLLLFRVADTLRRALAETARAGTGFDPNGLGEIGEDLLKAETFDDYCETLTGKLTAFYASGVLGPSGGKRGDVIETVQSMVQQNYADATLCLVSLAQAAKMSARSLSRTYREHTGQSLPEHINEVRMQKAAQLLESTDLSVGAIAARVGILNETYFYSVFKKRYAISPGQYKIRRAPENAPAGMAGHPYTHGGNGRVS